MTSTPVPSAEPGGPARNRVTPLGQVVAAPGWGAWMGNRGVLHGGTGRRDVVRQFRNRAWITCLLSFRGRSVPQWQPGRYTPLFFLDEAVAFAAGHRPCAECRRAAYNAYRSGWPGPDSGPDGGPDAGPPSAQALDERLNLERGTPGARRLVPVPWAGLPDGAFVLLDPAPAVVVGDHLALWRPDNTYAARIERPRSGRATLITPPASVAVLKAGYPVQIDDSAR